MVSSMKPSYQTPPEVREAHRIMNRAGFDQDLKWRSIVWAARSYYCDDCEAEPGKPCVSLADLRNRDAWKREHPKPNKWPHEIRPNWDYLVKTLKKKGYE